MKKARFFIAMLLVFSTLLTLPAVAEVDAEPRSSKFYSAVDAYVMRAGKGKAIVSFQVTGTHKMNLIGVNDISVYDSSTGKSVKHIYYTDSGYSSMMSKNLTTYANDITISLPSGKTYYMYVYFYVKDDYGASTKPFKTAKVTV